MNERQTLLKEMSTRLKEIREALKYSRPQMAVHLGVSPQTYAKYEYGSFMPGHRALHVLVNALDVSLNWLIAGKGTMFLSQPEPAEVERGAKPGTAGLEEDIGALLDHMDRIPLLRYEVLRFFYKFKLEYPDLPES
jgi:transcriptional regulator with XRE-family HTH domain